MTAFDVIVNGIALGRVDYGSFPLSLKVAVHDAEGRVHHIIDKEPVLAAIPMALDIEFPTTLGVHGICLRVDGHTADVQFAYGVSTTDGLATLTFAVEDVHWM